MATQKEINQFKDLIWRGVDQDRAKRLIREVRDEWGVTPAPKKSLRQRAEEQWEISSQISSQINDKWVDESIDWVNTPVNILQPTEETNIAWTGKLTSIWDPLEAIADVVPLWWIAKTLTEWAETFISEPLSWFAKTSKEASESFTTKATWEEWIKEWVKNILLNIIPSLWTSWAELIDTVANPADTTSWLLNLWQWLSDKLVFGILDTVTWQDKRTISAQSELVDNVTKEIVEKYWTPSKFWKATQENPALLLEIWVSAIKKSSRFKLSKWDLEKIKDLEKESLKEVKEFLDTKKITTKQIGKKISPELIERIKKWEIKPWDREQILEFANEQVQTFWKQFWDFIWEWKVKWDIDFEWMIDALVKSDTELRIDWVLKPWNELAANFINKQLDFLWQLQDKYGKNIPTNKQVELRQLYDKVFDKTVTRDAISKFQDDLDVKLADVLRKELAKNNPDLAEINKNLTFYKWLEFVLEDALNRKQWHDPVWLINTIRQWQQWTVWAVVWWWIWWALTGGSPIWIAVWWVLWGTVWAKLTRLTWSPKFKLIDAVKKKKLADAIAKWDAWKVEKIVDALIISEWIKDFNEQQLPSTKQIIW